MQVTFLLGSKSDTEHSDKIGAILSEFDIPHRTIVASAHKVPEKVVDILNEINADTSPHVVITVVGMSNGLAGVAAGGCLHPVLNCPPHTDHSEYLVDIHSSLRMPKDVPVMTTMHPKNAALAAAKILAESDAELRSKIAAHIQKVKDSY